MVWHSKKNGKNPVTLHWANQQTAGVMPPIVGGAQIVSDEGTYPESFATNKEKGNEGRGGRVAHQTQYIIYKTSNVGGAFEFISSLGPPAPFPSPEGSKVTQQQMTDWSQDRRRRSFYMAAVSIWTYSCLTPTCRGNQRYELVPSSVWTELFMFIVLLMLA